MHPLAELGLDLVRSERAWDRLPHWDPRLWQAVDEGLQCKPKRDARRLNTLGIDWAKRSLQRSQHETAPQLASTRPSHGRPERSEDGRKGGGTARAGSARSARRQATTGGAAASQTAMPAEHASTRRAGRGWAARQAYGAKESDYRPERWKGFREDYGFTGKEEDVEVGLTYFGRRFLSPYLGRWVSADPLGVHVPGEADLNLYAYVRGTALKAIDPLGLQEYPEGSMPAPPVVATQAENGDIQISEIVIPGKAPPQKAPPAAAPTDGSAAGEAVLGLLGTQALGAAKEATQAGAVGALTLLCTVCGAYVGAQPNDGMYELAKDPGQLVRDPYLLADVTGRMAFGAALGGLAAGVPKLKLDKPAALKGQAAPGTFPSNPADLLPDVPHSVKPNGNRIIQPSETLRIRAEQHALKPGETFSPRHHGQHYHVEMRLDPSKSWNNTSNVVKVKPPSYKPGEGTGFLPGEPFPGL